RLQRNRAFAQPCLGVLNPSIRIGPSDLDHTGRTIHVAPFEREQQAVEVEEEGAEAQTGQPVAGGAAATSASTGSSLRSTTSTTTGSTRPGRTRRSRLCSQAQSSSAVSTPSGGTSS